MQCRSTILNEGFIPAATLLRLWTSKLQPRSTPSSSKLKRTFSTRRKKQPIMIDIQGIERVSNPREVTSPWHPVGRERESEKTDPETPKITRGLLAGSTTTPLWPLQENVLCSNAPNLNLNRLRYAFLSIHPPSSELRRESNIGSTKAMVTTPTIASISRTRSRYL